MSAFCPRHVRLLSLAACVFAACTDDSRSDAGVSDVGFAMDAEDVDSGPPDLGIVRIDAGVLIAHDAGAPLSCATTCDCPQGLACLEGRCRASGLGPVFCCERAGCPEGQACLDQRELPRTCPPAPDAGPDAGVPDVSVVDGGVVRVIGAACQSDLDCDTTAGLSCWEESAPPYLHGGYCTLENCMPSCPTGSTCVQFSGGLTPPLGCMQTCATDVDCRSDAYCFSVPGAAIKICFPDCVDDLIDCSPRNGATFCSPDTGRCEATPMQTVGALAGDPCNDNRDCGNGQVCMTERYWGFPGGMCTKICSGLPEAAPCGADETCQSFAGVGMCFRNCENNACPNRVNALCGVLDAAWAMPSCVAQ